jgi:hypothetical protein
MRNGKSLYLAALMSIGNSVVKLPLHFPTANIEPAAGATAKTSSVTVTFV